MKENNKLIAEFMGLDTEVFWSDKVNYYFNSSWYEEHELSYNVSWDWLMPVVEKCLIGEAEREDFIYQDIYDGLTNISLSRTYNAVVEFINQNNKNNE